MGLALWLALMAAFALVVANGCTKQDAPAPVPAADADVTVAIEAAADSLGTLEYACPMHPEVHQAMPGQCSVCGMTLEAVSHDEGDGAVPDSLDHDQID